MNVTVSQDKFLSNNNNKSKLISMLPEKFEANNCLVKYAKDYADVLIIETALEHSSRSTIVIVGEDVDLARLLIKKYVLGKKEMWNKNFTLLKVSTNTKVAKVIFYFYIHSLGV